MSSQDTNKLQTNILLVEDDEAFREVLVSSLEAKGFSVRQAENGLVAKTILGLNPEKFQLVVSDIKMPEMTGMELLTYVRESHPTIRFIMMSGFSDILDGIDLTTVPFDAFLPKPFKFSKLLKLIEQVMSKKDASEMAAIAALTIIEEDEFSFCRIKVEDFVTSSALPSDVYVKLADNRFVRVGKEGSEIPMAKIELYKEKKVDFFYVKVTEFHKYTGLNLRIAKAISNSTTVSKEQKLKIFKHTSEILVNHVFLDGISKEDIEASSAIINNTINALGEAPAIFDLLGLLQGHNDVLYGHSVAVATYSCLIAKKMGWVSQSTLTKLSMAGLFHDIGKKEIPLKILSKSRRDMTPEEIVLLESHPTRSRDILMQTPGVPGDVIQIAFQHHENNAGTGYPLRTHPSKVHPLAKIICLADDFVHRVMSLQNDDPQSVDQTLSQMYDHKLAEFDPMMLKALMEVFSYPVPTALLKYKNISPAM